MAKINVSLPDGSKREFEAGISLLDIAKSLNQKLGKTALLAKVDGVNKDLADSGMLLLNSLRLTVRKASMLSVIRLPMSWPKPSSTFSREPSLPLVQLLKKDSIMILTVSTFLRPMT